MFNIICVTNRGLCKDGFLPRIEKIAKARPKAIILREKDLNKADYKLLAVSVMEICRKYDTPCILHGFADVAIELKAGSIHLPLNILRKLSDSEKLKFSIIGASCHSVSDALEAESLGCSYITIGHIFETDCKKGLAGRGLDFLKGVCDSVSIPAYAIGGIDKNNYADVCKAGAKGACIMSGAMCCGDVDKYLEGFRYEV